MSRTKKLIIITMSVLLALAVLIGIYAICIDFYIKHDGNDRIYTAENAAGTYDCIIVLGCGVKDDGRPSDMLYDRIITGVEAYKMGLSSRIIMSGDHGKADYDEVGVMKKYAIDLGVPESAIFCDHAGFSTYESIVRAKKIFSVESALIVTQKYHLYRALYDAKRFGIKADGMSADVRRYRGNVTRNVREIIARNKDFLFCIFKPDPKYLGEKIDLNGNGNITNG